MAYLSTGGYNDLQNQNGYKLGDVFQNGQGMFKGVDGVPSSGSNGVTALDPNTLVQKKNLTYEQILELLQMPSYTAKDDATLKKTAQDMFAPQYNAETEAAKQTQAQTDLSLQNQLSALLTNVGSQREELLKSVFGALSQQQQSSLQRGMQRSSFNQAAQAGIQAQGIKANDQISQNLLQQQSAVESQRQQNTQQLAETLGRLLVDKTTNENNLMQQLRDQDYERGMTALDMRNQLYQWLAGTYWPGAKDTAGLPEALVPKLPNQENTDPWVAPPMFVPVEDANPTKSSGGSGSSKKDDGKSAWEKFKEQSSKTTYTSPKNSGYATIN